MNEQKYCPVMKKCSGCQLSNMDYSRQLRFKQNEVRIRFNRMCRIEKIIPAPSPLHYRNKAQFLFKRVKGHIESGIYQSADRTVVTTKACALHTEEQNKTAEILCRLFESFRIEPYDMYKHKGLIKSVFIRQSFHTGELMVVLVCDKGKNFPREKAFCEALVKEAPSISSIILTTHSSSTLNAGKNPRVIYGKESITDRICGFDFVIGYNSFFQINPVQTENLYNTAVSMAKLSKDDKVLDAYCGTGTIGMICSPHCKKVFSVELNENAVRDAHTNMKLNSISNVNLVCADSEKYIRELENNNEHLDVALLDPPRAGCSKSFLVSLCKLSPDRIVYISCNIDTQLRDVRYLLKQGYTLKKVQGVDMFPYTKHVECVVLLTKYTDNKSQQK